MATESQQQVEERALLWTLLGPGMLLLTASTCLLYSDFDYLHLPAITAVGLFLVWRMPGSGLVVALFFLTLFTIYSLAIVDVEERFWLFGLSLSVALGLLITHLSLEESRNLVACLRCESGSRLEEMWKLQEKLQNEGATWEEERKALRELVTTLEEELAESHSNTERWRRAIHLARREVETLQVECQSQQVKQQEQGRWQQRASLWLEQLNKLRCDHFQQKINQKPSHTTSLLLRQMAHVQGSYHQLQEQFQQKQRELDRARDELFLIKEADEVAKRNAQEKPLEEVDLILQQQQQNADLRAEIEQLTQLIDTLTQELHELWTSIHV